MTQEEFEEQRSHSFKLGVSSGLNEAADIVLAAARSAFDRPAAPTSLGASSQDEKAYTLRDMAVELRTHAKVVHPGPPKEGAPEGPALGAWVSVEDRLPPDLTDVLLVKAPGQVRVGSYLNREFWEDGRGYLGESVTHWMPLPSSPEKIRVGE